MPLSFSTLRLEVLDANADAMALLAEGNLDESRAHLDDAAELLLRARKRIDLSSSVSETLSVSNASNEDEGGRQCLLKELAEKPLVNSHQ